jgi:type I restriction-modification system DNA methylase subunit
MKRNARIKKRSLTLARRAGITGRHQGAGTHGMQLSELKTLWQTERDEYKRSEVGTGVQRFVWEMLKSEDFFGLAQGLKSTPDHQRRSEFLLEERRKNGQADAVIFMDAEVVIPVEVEKYEKAHAGEWQILGYRTAFEKKYGILTDGFEWRFYYGEIADELYVKFTLQQMFANPARFRTFWEEYVKPENYYLAFFEQVGQQSFAFHDEPKSVDKHRYRFFEDVTEIIRKLKDKFLNAGYFKTLGGDTEEEEKNRNKKATEIAYSYLIQFILYKTLVDNGFPTFEHDFKKKADVVYKNLKRGSYNEVLMILEGISERISDNIYKPFHDEQSLILTEVNELVRSGEDSLISVAPFLDIFVLIKRYYFGNVQNDIFGAIYENYLKELYGERLGQYFTDPEVVNFMLEEIGYNAKEINRRKHKDISIIDPSCGSGTFLYSAIREIVKAGKAETEADARRVEADVLGNAFGLDIAEFPLYLAEMSILMKMLPLILNEKYNNPVDNKLRLYVTEDSLSEFTKDVGSGSQGKLEFGWEYHGFMRDESDLSEMKQSLADSADKASGKRFPRRRFDFVIGNPPYIGYNEASKSVGVKLFRMMKEGSVKLSNIYGWNLHSAPGRQKKYPPKPNLYAFFLALGFALLKDNGRFCYIIPQTMLTEPDYDVVRYHLSHDYTIESLITFAGKLFVGRGTSQSKEVHTSSLILIATKSAPPADHAVECVRSPETGEDVRDVIANLRKNRHTLACSIAQSELRDNFDNWNFITWDAALAKAYTRYKQHSESMTVYSEHRFAERRFGARFYFDVGFTLDREKERDQPSKGMWGLVDFKDFVNFTNFRPTKFYPGNEDDIELPKNSQGYQALYPRHKLLWDKSRRIKLYYTDANVVPSMSHCQIISSDNKEEIFFLFAVLNSSITRRIYEAMFSLDNEKVGMYVVVSRFKRFLRPPLVDTPAKATAKKKIIGLVGKALAMEERVMSGFVDIDTLVHRVDDVRVNGRQLVITHGEREISFPIARGSADLVDAALGAHFGDSGLLPASRVITVRELKSLPVFDEAAQSTILDEVEEIVLDLYGVGGKTKR